MRIVPSFVYILKICPEKNVFFSPFHGMCHETEKRRRCPGARRDVPQISHLIFNIQIMEINILFGANEV